MTNHVNFKHTKKQKEIYSPQKYKVSPASMAGGDGQSEPVILATAGYDHTIRFWQAYSGICNRTVQHPDSISFSLLKISLKTVLVICFQVL